MEAPLERAVRWFVGLSLVAGALMLGAGSLPASSGIIVLALVLATVLTALAAFWEKGPRSPWVPASAWIGTVLFAMVWAHLDPSSGHVFLSRYAPFLAFATGVGLLLRHLWAWPVAFASVVGFGPIVLLLAPLPAAAVAGGFVLFFVDAVALLVIHRAYFEPRR